MDPADRSRPADLLAELTGLHDMLAEPSCDPDTIPLLQEIVTSDRPPAATPPVAPAAPALATSPTPLTAALRAVSPGAPAPSAAANADTTAGTSLQHLRPQLMQKAESLLQEILHELTPQITAELDQRLRRHLEQLIREQEQLRLESPPDTPA